MTTRKKERIQREKDRIWKEEYEKKRREHEEQERTRREKEEKRRASPPVYTDGISKSEFEAIVNDIVGKVPRIRSLAIEGLVIHIIVDSNSGLSDWSASIDFNDYGHLTGWYDVRTDNSQSPIPNTIAKRVKEGLDARRDGYNIKYKNYYAQKGQVS